MRGRDARKIGRLILVTNRPMALEMGQGHCRQKKRGRLFSPEKSRPLYKWGIAPLSL
jgi:hypothetical protein